MAEMEFAAALLDVVQDRTGQPAMGGSLQQVQLGRLSF